MASEDDPGSELGAYGVEDLIEVAERRRAWLLAGAIAGLALGAVAWLVLPPRYTSQTTILVEPQEVPDAFVKSTVTVDIENRLRTLHERVTSFANLNAIIDRIGADRLDPDGDHTREALMSELTRNLSVDLKAGKTAATSNVVEIAYTDDDPVLAKDLASEFSSTFISENTKDRTQQAQSTADFLDRELDRLRVEVSAAEQRVREFKEKRMGALPSQLESNLRSLDRLNLELNANLEAQTALQQRLALLAGPIPGGRPGGAFAPDPGSAAGALLEARRKLREVELVYTDSHPNVVQARERAEALERDAAEEARRPRNDTGYVDPATLAARREAEAARIESEARRREEVRLRAEIAELQRRVETTPQMETELLTLTRDYDNLTKQYQDLLSKKFAASMAKNLEQAQKAERFNVLRPARVPTTPSFPNPLLVLPAGAGVGLAFVLLLIAITEFRNASFRSVARLARLTGLPVVASVPRIDGDRIYEERPNGEVDARLVVFTAPESAPAEQYRSFLPVVMEDPERRVVLVTSAARGDGKSLSCMNLALTLACDLGRQVLLIDGDMRRPTAHRLLRERPERGLVDTLRRQASFRDCVIRTRIPNLTLLPAGRPTRNPLGLITDPAFLELIEQARKEYDYIFIDSPPMLPVVDTRFLRKVADFVVFVVRADATPRDAVLRSMRELRSVGGLVFNHVSPGSFRRYYYYDAYSRYSYGEPAGEDAERES
ncbi:tyrosine-protein kinase Etk/Wzc [Myxococcaceae bacterium]|nr:tyrosine-protein kinase Etk/Wzc [Myxococcaceae bacterium]